MLRETYALPDRPASVSYSPPNQSPCTMQRILTLLPVALLCSVQLLFSQTLHYQIAPEEASTGGKLKLNVTLTFIPSATDTTRFRLPTQINWSQGLENCFRQIKKVEGRPVPATDGVNVIAVTDKNYKDKAVTISYQVIQNFPGEQVTIQTPAAPSNTQLNE